VTIDRRTLLAFVGVVLIGGANWVAAKFSNGGLPPLLGASMRFAPASLVLLLIIAIMRLPLPRGRALLFDAGYGFLFGAANGFGYSALVGLSSGASSVVFSMIPIVTLAFAVIVGQEKFSLAGILGSLLTIGGVLVLSARALGGELSLIYVVLALIGTCLAAAGTVVIKGAPKTHPVSTNAVAMGTAALVLATASLLFREKWVIPSELQTYLAVAWLSLVGSVVLFALFLFVVRSWTASASVYALTLTPPVTVAISVLLGRERLTPELVVGGVLVMLGVYVGAVIGVRHESVARKVEAAPGVASACRDAELSPVNLT
jgi:drug/metabolite transporter (DMT)-like permease